MSKHSPFPGLPTAMFNPDKLTATEFKFIKAYVAAMKRDYDLLSSVMHLMDPEKLDVRCVVKATELAAKLDDLQFEFDARLRDVATAHRFRHVPAKPHPTTDAVADLFTLSFFKVVTKTTKGKSDNGMFSGEPDSWQQVFKNLQNANTHDQLTNMLSFYANSLFKMFPKFPGFLFDLPAGAFETHSSYGIDDNGDDDDDEWVDDDDESDDDNWFYDNQ